MQDFTKRENVKYTNNFNEKYKNVLSSNSSGEVKQKKS